MPNENCLVNNLKQICLINGIGLIVSLIFLFFGLYSFPLGYLLGTLILIINKIIFHYKNKFENNDFNAWASTINFVAYFISFALVIGISFLSLYLEYIGVYLFSWISILLAYFIGDSPLLIKKILERK